MFTWGARRMGLVGLFASAAVLLLLLLAGCAGSQEQGGSQEEEEEAAGAQEVEDLKAVRAEYEGISEEQVRQLGYQPEPFCVDSSLVGEPGLGAMGFHAINEDLFEDMQPDQPPILLLDGGGKVAGIEYETEDASGPAPTFFGQEFELSPPHPGHEVDHWMLHIYFQPDGEELISAWNPDLSCPEGSLPPEEAPEEEDPLEQREHDEHS